MVYVNKIHLSEPQKAALRGFGIVVFCLLIGFVRGWWVYSHEGALVFPVDVVVQKPAYEYGLFKRFEVTTVTGGTPFMIVVDRSSEILYGDRLTVDGALSDYNIMYSPKVIIQPGENQGGWFYKKMFAVRDAIIARIGLLFPEPYARLVGGIVFGIDQDLGKQLSESMRSSGITHILVASGYNVTIVVAGITLLFRNIALNRKLAGTISVVCVSLYVVIAGMEPPVVRAAVMVCALVLAEFAGRQYHPLLILCYTGMCMLMYDVYLSTSLSFFLSIAATCAIFVIRPWVSKYFSLWAGFIRNDIVTTISVVLLTSPLLWFWLGTFQIKGILTNVAVLWIVPYVTWGSIGALLVSLVSLPIARSISFFVTMLLSYLLFVVEHLVT
ncbi:hypothetical protein CO180_02495 [candidate division WWE3 bacterium CG_4_9_14_3_um_filter_41_6]|uniref:ComEC/Rec2-related protein domain-containing protein n=1 Tax=candidate division WWE3 bacterium CG_4_10_14_0_2_um_filter_41_14 TaxID=1975072 RepID=A0A2M7TI18_UNCKA|nr:MAG: hypothetical protein COY32_04310 [candidate division WWE3 bacterium CG_4_10_14_0_2_um_filter_41_14]PJA38782.1 MAG: hypothetical protein CO180_02495 [candidate division WWE3 bacterium CG_4_9_14_3_um_filter_41_6]